ncbi:RdRP-domain-containing protein [Flagelloscypha sp. PMI_526]|nr:RdRP-domain-containing protein [Flagelloscypha sp. PMI_526]
MNIDLTKLPVFVNKWEVTRCLASLFFHNPEHNPSDESQPPVNFQVVLHPSDATVTRNKGTGLLTVPRKALGRKFLDFVHQNKASVKIPFTDDYGKKSEKRFLAYESEERTDKALVEILRKTPYIEPSIEETRCALNDLVSDYKFIVDEIQFGSYYRKQYPKTAKEPLVPRSFSIEWSRRFKDSSSQLSFEPDHKLLKVSCGDPNTESFGYLVSIPFANLNLMGVGHEDICFDTAAPCILESQELNRTMYGNANDHKKYRYRIGAINEGHRTFTDYAYQLRLVLHPRMAQRPKEEDPIEAFIMLCEKVGLSNNQVLRCSGSRYIDASCQEFFSSKKLYKINRDLKSEAWSIAFQIEALLRCGLFNTNDLIRVHPLINKMKAKHGVAYCGTLLARFREKLKAANLRRSPIQILEELIEQNTSFEHHEMHASQGQMNIYRVTFTPSRMILDGPLPTQTNRVLRQYKDFSEHFMRVDFRDEDRLQYRWDKAVDGASFVRERVGTILKDGFTLAGRHFQFLAYSSSAMREHAVWFIHPFHHPTDGLMTSDRIRRRVGKFEGTKLLKQPSRYAARLAQAFTATDPGVSVAINEWIVTKDLGVKPYLHTDGVGTISLTLGRRLWESQLADRPGLGQYQEPSTYQIRFLGFKGVVVVDPLLEQEHPGLHMLLRESMLKFEATEQDSQSAEIEVVRAFFSPNLPYLNRALIMILESLGVDYNAFQHLQDLAVREIRTIDDSSEDFRSVLYNHKLSTRFHIASIIERLEKLGGVLHGHGKRKIVYDNPFFQSVRNVTKAAVLRDIKHNARIPVIGDNNNFLLVGIADEGPVYAEKGMDVFCLPEGNVYACVQRSKSEAPIWLEGHCSVSRSPLAHPGDIQRVWAYGKPPADKICLFADVKNALVFSSLGERSLPSQLGGGDVDGDLYSILCEPTLLFSRFESPMNYTPSEPWTLDDDEGEANVNHICEFIVEYINSDVLGLLSDRLLIIADQSRDSIRDRSCIRIAQLCSQAVDYPKNGVPVDLDKERLPHTLIRLKPDWHCPEGEPLEKSLDYYPTVKTGLHPPVLPNPISILFRPVIDMYIPRASQNDLLSDFKPPPLFKRYADELQYICTVHSLTNTPGAALLEAEVVVGTILARCVQRRFRSSRIEQMRVHVDMLVRTVQRDVHGIWNPESRSGEDEREDMIEVLKRAWQLWEFLTDKTDVFGANSLGLLALRIICDVLNRLEG